MTQILLTHSYHIRFDPKEHRAMNAYPPLGTLYAASLLRASGYSVAMHDTMFDESTWEFARAVDTHRPKIVAIYDDQFNYLTKMCLTRMREAAFAMSAIAKAKGCAVVVFSSDASDHAAEYLDHGADFVLTGESDQTLVELARHLLQEGGNPAEAITGIVWRNGSLRSTQRRVVMKELDLLPHPAWDLIDPEGYRSRWMRVHGRFSLNVSTTRGCPFHCNWCAKPIYGQVYNSHSPRWVAEEFRILKKELGAGHVWITDDIFGLKPGWIAAFSEEIRSRDAGIPFKCQSRADLLLDPATVRALRNAGCETVWLGAESGAQSVLDAMEKGLQVEQIRRATELLHATGIRVGFFLQFGYPGETRREIDATLSMVHDFRPDEIGISVSYPLPGTGFYDRMKERMGEKRNWRVSEDLDMMFPGAYPPGYYRTLHRWVHKKHQIWKGIDLLRGSAPLPVRDTGARIRQLAKALYHGTTLPRYSLRLSRMEKGARIA